MAFNQENAIQMAGMLLVAAVSSLRVITVRSRALLCKRMSLLNLCNSEY